LEVDDAIQRRLENGDPVTLPIGKLLERLLVFKQLYDKSTVGGIWRLLEMLPVFKWLFNFNPGTEEKPKAKFYVDLLKIAEERLKQIK
jgi:hypothetical protein